MLKFGFVGIGQCGGKIADCFAKLEYPTLALNTTEKDMNSLTQIPPEYRVKIAASGTKGGAGKDPSVGGRGMAEHMDEVMTKVNAIMEGTDFIFISAGMGGGTGSGATPVLLERLLADERKVGLILTMPDTSEGVEVKGNAIQSLVNIYQLVAENEVPMMIIDNDKIVKQMNSSKDFDWRTVNDLVAKTFNQFNIAANRSSPYVTFDESDYLKTISRPGLFTLSRVTLTVEEMTNDQILKEKVLNSWQSELFTVNTDYSSSQMMAIIVEAPTDFLKNRGNYKLLDSSLNSIRNEIGVASRYEGIYPLGQEGSKFNRITVYTFLSGMPAPMEKISSMYELAQKEEAKMIEKIQKTQSSFDLSKFASVGNVFNKTKDKKPSPINTTQSPMDMLNSLIKK